MGRKETWTLKITIPAGQAANSTLNVKIIRDPRTGEEDYIQMVQTFYVHDVYVLSSPSIDCILIFEKNDTRVVAKTPPLSALDVTKTNRPFPFGKDTVLGYESLAKLTIKAINLEANSGTADVEVTAYMEVEIEE